MSWKKLRRTSAVRLWIVFSNRRGLEPQVSVSPTLVTEARSEYPLPYKSIRKTTSTRFQAINLSGKTDTGAASKSRRKYGEKQEIENHSRLKA